MDAESLITHLELNARRIQCLVEGVTEEQARWKPDEKTWSILEVVNHLYDEEREDFRLHLEQLLRDPEEPWVPYDPPAWVTERAYNQRDLDLSLQNFLAERAASLVWLHGLASPKWDNRRQAASGGLSAGEVMASWAAHDLLHLRQLVELEYAFIQRLGQPYRLNYAGDW
jgi:hypothetical protein